MPEKKQLDWEAILSTSRENFHETVHSWFILKFTKGFKGLSDKQLHEDASTMLSTLRGRLFVINAAEESE